MNPQLRNFISRFPGCVWGRIAKFLVKREIRINPTIENQISAFLRAVIDRLDHGKRIQNASDFARNQRASLSPEIPITLSSVTLLVHVMPIDRFIRYHLRSGVPRDTATQSRIVNAIKKHNIHPLTLQGVLKTKQDYFWATRIEDVKFDNLNENLLSGDEIRKKLGLFSKEYDGQHLISITICPSDIDDLQAYEPTILEGGICFPFKRQREKVTRYNTTTNLDDYMDGVSECLVSPIPAKKSKKLDALGTASGRPLADLNKFEDVISKLPLTR